MVHKYVDIQFIKCMNLDLVLKEKDHFSSAALARCAVSHGCLHDAKIATTAKQQGLH